LDQEGLKGQELASAGFCYSYAVLKEICLLVKYQKERDISDFETGTDAWTFTGGCFKNGHALLYESAEADQTYDFKDLRVEVRLDHRYSEFLQSEEAGRPSQDEVESGSTALKNKDAASPSPAGLAATSAGYVIGPGARVRSISQLPKPTQMTVEMLREELESQR